MSNTHPDTLVDVCKDILSGGEGRAFEAAKDEFHRTYASAYSASLRSADHDQAHDEALNEGLEAFLATYLSETDR